MKHSRSSLFLMELIIAILIFSLPSAVCIRLFARSHILSTHTIEQNNAITYAQNLAESWYAFQGNLEKMTAAQLGSSLSEDGNTFFLLFDEDWNLLTTDAQIEQAFYRAQLTAGDIDEKGLLNAEIRIGRTTAGTLSDADTFYTLELTQYIAKRRGSL